MNILPSRVVGIVGGMGPQSGIALLDSITSQTRAGCDQEHLSTILMSFPRNVADRTSFLEGVSPDNPAEAIIGIIHRLEQAGADVVGIACNTSHVPAIFDVVVDGLARAGNKVRLLHMPREVCRFLLEEHPGCRRIGMMTTNGTYRAGLYGQLLEQLGFEAIVPEPEFQYEVIHRMVYDPITGVKSVPWGITWETRSLMKQALAYFRQRKADGIILGCTELSLVLRDDLVGDMVVADSTRIFAGALIREALDIHSSSKNESSWKIQPSGGIPMN